MMHRRRLGSVAPSGLGGFFVGASIFRGSRRSPSARSLHPWLHSVAAPRLTITAPRLTGTAPRLTSTAPRLDSAALGPTSTAPGLKMVRVLEGQSSVAREEAAAEP